MAVDVCLRLQLVVRFTGIYNYVHLLGVTEQSFTLERKTEKSFYHMLFSYLFLEVFFLVLSLAFQV